jgi:hypothetical protein
MAFETKHSIYLLFEGFSRTEVRVNMHVPELVVRSGEIRKMYLVVIIC